MEKDIDIVIIGLNAEKTLKKCIESIYNQEYDKGKIRIIYVDGGSNDRSLEIAKEMNVEFINLNLKYPTPGRQRNEGWKYGKSEFIQFLDSDTEIDKNWLKNALPFMEKEEVGAVFGNRMEKYPENSTYNFIGNLEWNPPNGEVDFFGGDVLVKREVLKKTLGYNDQLIAGEDPECAYRFKKEGYKIIKIDYLMTWHDLAMYTLKQYWKRSYRSGHAFAEIHFMHKDVWKQELKRILLRGGLSLILFFSGLILSYKNSEYLLILILGIFVLIRPRLSLTKYFKEQMGIGEEDSKLYAWHASFVVVPQLFGVFRFYLGRLFNVPLKNKGKNQLAGPMKNKKLVSSEE